MLPGLFFYGEKIMDKVYVTTSIPYVNGRPHVGFALELVQADVLARYYRLQGKEVRLQTGADENAYKNVLSAREQGWIRRSWWMAIAGFSVH